MTGSQNLHEDNHLEFSGPPVLDLPTFITTSTGLRSGQAPRPPKRTHSVSSLPSPVFDYTPLMQHLKSNPDARLVPYEPAVAAKVVEQQISVTEGQSLGGLAGIPSEGESITILDSRETLASARTVRFAAVREAEERIPSFSNSTSTASLSAQEPQSILKAGAGPSPIDIAALQNSYSDSGSEGLSDYDEDTEEGSVSDESSADEEPDSASETQGHNGRNGDLREISSRRKFRNRGTSEDEPELQSEIEITDDPTEDDSAAPPVRDGTVTASDIGVRLENATLADYEDMDGLLNTLDKYIKKNRHSRSLAPPTMNNPLAGLKAIKTKAAPSWAMEAADTASAQSEKKPDAQTIHATLQRSQIDVPREINGRDVQDQAEILLAKLTEANVKKITTRIYIEDARSFKTLQLTSLMSADQIINDVVTRFHLEQSPNWTLFELCNDLGIERPIRDWEIVTDVISAWDISTSINAIVMKKYGYRDTVSPRAIAGKYPRVQGWMYMEVKPGKWQRKFFVLRESNLYYYKDAKQSGVESLFCGVGNYDVYTLSQRRKKTPTQFCFALRSTDSITFFENKKDYVRYLCVEKQERLYDWVLAIRLAKSEKTFADFPELFEDYEEISEKARQRVIRHMEPPSPVLAKPPTREKIELKRVDMVDVRREDPRRTTSSPEPIARRTTDVRRHTEPPKRTRTQRRSRESPSETDDEPLFVRQMRQNPQPKADEGQEVSDGLNRGSTRLKRGSNTERARDGDPSAARRDMEREKARGENSRRRKARASAEMEQNSASDGESDQPLHRATTKSHRHRSKNEQETKNSIRSPPSPPKPLLAFPGDDRNPERERKFTQRRRHSERRGEQERGRNVGDSVHWSSTRKSRHGSTAERDRELERPSTSTLIERMSDPTRSATISSSSRNDLQRSATRHHSSRRRTEPQLDRERYREGPSRSKSIKVKPLIDISDSSNCRKCGCSEFRRGNNGACGNCYHVHKDA